MDTPDRRRTTQSKSGTASLRPHAGADTLRPQPARGSTLHAVAVSVGSWHTLAEENQSTSVLRHCGFERTTEVLDPQQGRVWRWELDAFDDPNRAESGVSRSARSATVAEISARPVPPGAARSEVEVRTEVADAELARLVEVWRSAVRATHDFLTPDDTAYYEYRMIRQYLPAVAVTVAVVDEQSSGFPDLPTVDSRCSSSRTGTEAPASGRFC